MTDDYFYTIIVSQYGHVTKLARKRGQGNNVVKTSLHLNKIASTMHRFWLAVVFIEIVVGHFDLQTI